MNINRVHNYVHSVWSYICFPAVQSLNSLNDQIAHFMVNRPNAIGHEEDTFLPPERDTLKQSMALMRHLLMDAQVHHICWQTSLQLPVRQDGVMLIVAF